MSLSYKGIAVFRKLFNLLCSCLTALAEMFSLKQVKGHVCALLLLVIYIVGMPHQFLASGHIMLGFFEMFGMLVAVPAIIIDSGRLSPGLPMITVCLGLLAYFGLGPNEHLLSLSGCMLAIGFIGLGVNVFAQE